MYAVIDDSGCQFKVSEGDRIDVDLREANAGDVIEFDRVLLTSGEDGTRVGTPMLEDVKVRGEVEDEIKAKKVICYKFRRRKNSSATKKGHRQRYLRVRITEILVPQTA